MNISPINLNISGADKAISTDAKNYIPTTVRTNSLADMEFSIIADTIRCQNLKNQMNVRLINLRKSLNRCMAMNLYGKNN